MFCVLMFNKAVILCGMVYRYNNGICNEKFERLKNIYSVNVPMGIVIYHHYLNN